MDYKDTDVVKEALLIKANGVFVFCTIVENLPKKFLFRKTAKLMQIEPYEDRMVPAFSVDEKGKKTPTGELVDELQGAIQMDGAGSGAFVFDLHSDEAGKRVQAIEEYVNSIIKDPELRIKWQPYAQRFKEASSSPVAYNSILRVRLPSPVSPSVATPLVTGQAEAHPESKKKVRKPMTEEHKQKLRDALAKARALKTNPVNS